MQPEFFSSPVVVLVGLGFKREVATLSELHEFLLEWSPSRRNAQHGSALRACEGAQSGIVTTEQARRAFMQFADAAGILQDEIEPVVAAKALAASRRRHPM